MQERRQQPWDFLLGLFERAYNVSRFPGFLTSVCHFNYYISDRLHNSSLIRFLLYLLTPLTAISHVQQFYPLCPAYSQRRRAVPNVSDCRSGALQEPCHPLIIPYDAVGSEIQHVRVWANGYDFSRPYRVPQNWPLCLTSQGNRYLPRASQPARIYLLIRFYVSIYDFTAQVHSNLAPRVLKR